MASPEDVGDGGWVVHLGQCWRLASVSTNIPAFSFRVRDFSRCVSSPCTTLTSGSVAVVKLLLDEGGSGQPYSSSNLGIPFLPTSQEANEGNSTNCLLRWTRGYWNNTLSLLFKFTWPPKLAPSLILTLASYELACQSSDMQHTNCKNFCQNLANYSHAPQTREIEKYSYEFIGIWNEEWLCWRGSAEIYLIDFHNYLTVSYVTFVLPKCCHS